jgi:archaetidylinositol phosphate synthase
MNICGVVIQMVLDTKRENIDPLLSWFAKKMTFLSANTITWLALLFAIISGFFFYISDAANELMGNYLLFASLFIFLNGFFDALDGKIAKMNKTASLRGDFLDHALDRYADVFIVGGIAISSWCDLRIGFFAIIGMLLTSYMGTQSQAIGLKRMYAGVLGRADRITVLIFTPFIQHILIRLGIIDIYLDFNLIEWAMIYLAIMGNFTALQRFYQTLRYFKKEK